MSIFSLEPEPGPPALPRDLVFSIARTPRELAGFWRLRHDIFCREQRLFAGSDRDEHDDAMTPIVCQSLVLGAADEVIGCVRIYEAEPGIWWGGRLGVAESFRHLDGLSPSSVQRNRLPDEWVDRSVGSGLIFKAVSMAVVRGCLRFLAHVQSQNVPGFRRLGWRGLEELDLRGRPHTLMEADLDLYAQDAAHAPFEAETL